MEPLVSIVIPNFNSSTLIKKCLQSTLNTDYPNFEVIVVDDCSTDNNLKIIEDFLSRDTRLKLVRKGSRSGPSATRNVGIAVAKGEYIAFLETDTEVESNWLKEIIYILENDRSIGAAQSKVLDMNHRNRIVATGIHIIPYVAWVIGIGFAEDKNAHNSAEEVSIGAVGSVVRREVLGRVGGFDEKLTHNIDDIDWGWRIWLGGNRIISVPNSITYHWGSKPSRVRERITSRLDSETHSNKVPRIFIKNYETSNLIKYLPFAILILFLRAIFNLAKGNPVPFMGFIKATAWNLKVLPDTLKERRRIQHFIRRVPDSFIMQKIMTKGSLRDIWKM